MVSAPLAELCKLLGLVLWLFHFSTNNFHELLMAKPSRLLYVHQGNPCCMQFLCTYFCLFCWTPVSFQMSENIKKKCTDSWQILCPPQRWCSHRRGWCWVAMMNNVPIQCRLWCSACYRHQGTLYPSDTQSHECRLWQTPAGNSISDLFLSHNNIQARLHLLLLVKQLVLNQRQIQNQRQPTNLWLCSLPLCTV